MVESFTPCRLIRSVLNLLLVLAIGQEPLAAWTVELLYGKDEIFPSVLASLTDRAPFPPAEIIPAQLGDPKGLVAVKLVSPRDHCRVRVEVSAMGLFDHSSVEVELPRKGQTYRVAPFLRYNHDNLLTIRHPIVGEQLLVTVTIDGKTDTREHTVRVHAINDCLTSVEVGGRIHEVAYLAAAYANEYNTEIIKRITDHALKNHYVATFDGYESGDPDQVRAQVDAVYQSLQDLGVKYSTIYQASVNTGLAGTQWIRLPGESMLADQANCADGAVLFASALTQIHLRPVLFFEPYEHVFLGVYLTSRGDESAGFDVVETTEVGYADYSQACKEGAKKLAQLRARRGMREFRLTDSQSKKSYTWQYESGKQQRPDVFFSTDISAARRLGILPLAEAAVLPLTSESP